MDAVGNSKSPISDIYDKQSHVFGPGGPSIIAPIPREIYNLTSSPVAKPCALTSSPCNILRRCVSYQEHFGDSVTATAPARFRLAQPSTSRNYESPSGPMPGIRWPSQIHPESLPFLDCRQALTSPSGFQNTNSLSPRVELQLNP